MLSTVRTFIENENLLTAGSSVIVGVSGGMDSMALLDLLVRLGYPCVAAHCNFHLRGKESDRDADFVENWCKDADIPFTSVSFDTREYASEKKISIEMAARELRYRWFEILREQYGAQAIAIAHQRDDSVETVLLNLIRGTGIRGLAGIPPKNKNVIRPLLCVTRVQIAQYIKERDIPFVTDSSNNDDLFWRNLLRLQVIPLLGKLNPSVKEAIYRTSQNVAEAEKVYTASVRESIDKVFHSGSIHIPELRETPSPLSVLYELLFPLGFGPAVIHDIYECMDAVPGKVFYGGQYRVIKDRDRFIIDRPAEATDQATSFWIDPAAGEITQPLHLVMRTLKMPVTIQKERRMLYVDYDRLHFPLQLRKWREGDWFIPFGMKGRKKLSDYFTDRKFSLQDKENAWVLLSGDDIVWIVGERPDNRFRITDHTINVFAVTYKKDD